jgi:Protein of unknown function (DUF4239)
MVTSPPMFVEHLLALPLPVMGMVVLGGWGAIAVLIHRVLVPRIAGHDGGRIGHFEAEVASQLGIILGLLLSFNAVTVWEQSGAARDAVLAEASALREIHELQPDLPQEQRDAVRRTLGTYLAYLIDDEWPRLGTDRPGLHKPESLRALARLSRASGNDDLHDSVAAAIAARDDRIRIATSRMLPARWGIVGVLGTLALLAIGLIHAENRRGRAVAVGMVAFAIASCFLVLMAQTRPFLGSLALRPVELEQLATKIATERPGT